MAFGGRDPWRIVLLGKTGAGKSAAGNTILGENVFQSEIRATSVTTTCSGRNKVVNGRSITVIDTPGLYDTCMSRESIADEIVRGVQLVAPGPHAFLLVIDLKRFTQEEKNTVKNFQQMFGDEVHKHMIVLFTRGDDLEDKSIESFIQDSPLELKNLIAACGWRYHVFNNKEKRDRTQVTTLFQKINMMLRANNHSYYNYELFTMAARLSDVRTYDRARDQRIAELEAQVRSMEALFYTICHIQ